MYTDEELNSRIEAWHKGAGTPNSNLHEYLGWTWAQYKHWAETGQQPDDDELQEFKLVPIEDLYVQCALQIRNLDRPGYAASDNCGALANTGVVNPVSESIYWRCAKHEGVLDVRTGEKGTVVHKIMRRICT